MLQIHSVFLYIHILTDLSQTRKGNVLCVSQTSHTNIIYERLLGTPAVQVFIKEKTHIVKLPMKCTHIDLSSKPCESERTPVKDVSGTHGNGNVRMV